VCSQVSRLRRFVALLPIVSRQVCDLADARIRKLCRSYGLPPVAITITLEHPADEKNGEREAADDKDE
jgi:hypothetical protein